MNTEVRTFNVSRIIFESNDSEVMLKGQVNDGYLTYDSDLIISFSQLNSVLNSLASSNSSFSIDSYMNKEYMGDNAYLYEADLTQLNDNQIDLFDISYQSNVRQIRA
jgi:hypothetical protein